MATQVEKAISWARGKLGSSAYAGYCQRFVGHAYQAAGIPYVGVGSATNAFKKYAVYRGSNYSNIPIGAAVYFSCKNHNNGHVGIYVGNGQMIHTFPKVVQTTVAYVAGSRSYTYVGWGWQGGRKPTGAGETPTYTENVQTAETAQTEVQVIHIPQTEKLYTVYDEDSPFKPVDVYRVAWKSYFDTRTYDITARVGNLQMTDDSDVVCTELSFDVVGDQNDRYLPPLRIMCGDTVTVTNTATGQCVFVGSVQGFNGLNSRSVRCVDQGLLLTTNDVIMQFNNVSVKTAISNLANRVGIPSLSCPKLISSVYKLEKANAADILKDILETVTAENGVVYFPRMLGNTLVIKSFAETSIVPYCRQETNVAAFPVLSNCEAPQYSADIDDLRNQIAVYSDTDNGTSVLAAVKDDASIKRYGLRVGLESFSDQTGVTASAKGKTVLAQRNRWTETVTLSCYGSDKVSAGVRLTLDFEDLKGDFHVIRVTHQYGRPHTMSLELRRA